MRKMQGENNGRSERSGERERERERDIVILKRGDVRKCQKLWQQIEVCKWEANLHPNQFAVN
jgi:hypothetical protein